MLMGILRGAGGQGVVEEFILSLVVWPVSVRALATSVEWNPLDCALSSFSFNETLFCGLLRPSRAGKAFVSASVSFVGSAVGGLSFGRGLGLRRGGLGSPLGRTAPAVPLGYCSFGGRVGGGLLR